ncbi:MAG: dihydropteroate synthase [Parachlamydiales bacterium]
MHTKLMGILNATPDSSLDKGKHFSFEKAIQRAHEIYQQGADIIDIGGESTRPGAAPVSLEEEIQRVIPLIKEVRQSIPLPISIDTIKWQVAAAAVNAGATFINDVSGFRDPEMRRVGVESEATLFVMHMQGEPRTMQKDPSYSQGVIKEISTWLMERVGELLEQGAHKDKIYLDPGIGFGKTVAHNLEIVHNFAELKKLGFPLLLGLSRKSFMGKINNKSYEELLPESLAMHTIACMNGIDILRVHDVKESRDIINLLKAYSEHIPEKRA